MFDLVSIVLTGALLLFAGALALLAWQVRRAAAARLDADRRRDALAEETLRMELLDRRRALFARINGLWLCWSRCERPGRGLLADAAAAAEEARMLFPAELEPDLDEVAALLAEAARHQQLQEEAIGHGRHGDRVDLLEEEARLDRVLRPKIAGLRALLVEAARPASAA